MLSPFFSCREMLVHLSSGHNWKLSLLKVWKLRTLQFPLFAHSANELFALILQMNSFASAPCQSCELFHCHIVTLSDKLSLEV